MLEHLYGERPIVASDETRHKYYTRQSEEIMLENIRPVKRIFYRGHVIEATVPAIFYTIYGTRPLRAEIGCAGSSGKAMQWIDRQVASSRLGGFSVRDESPVSPRHLVRSGSW